MPARQSKSVSRTARGKICVDGGILITISRSGVVFLVPNDALLWVADTRVTTFFEGVSDGFTVIRSIGPRFLRTPPGIYRMSRNGVQALLTKAIVQCNAT